jgi:hypothetical protein
MTGRDGSGQVKFWTDHGSPLFFYRALAIGIIATIRSSVFTNITTFITSIMNARMFYKAEKNDEEIKKRLENIETKIDTLATKEELKAELKTLGAKIDKLPTTADFNLLMAKITRMTELQERNLQSESKRSSVLSEQQR